MSLQEFYEGKTLFITGALGFLGKILLAKLMRVGNVKEVLLLVRPKKDKTAQDRLDEVLSGFLFQEMEKFDRNFRAKLKVINGDMETEGLGISSADRDYIIENTEIIIHGAATVRFDEALLKAIAVNVRGTKILLDLGQKVKNLQNFVHISTAYSNCPRKTIDEVFYESPLDYRYAIKLLEDFDADEINAITDKLMRPWPNTYTFSKAISEDMIRQYLGSMPIAVIRPSIGDDILDLIIPIL